MGLRDLVNWARAEIGNVAGDTMGAPAFARLQREINDVFEAFLRGAPIGRPAPADGDAAAGATSTTDGGSVFAPVADVYETETALEVRVELPGVNAEEVSVTLEDDALVISGQKRREAHTLDPDGYCRYERQFGRFERRVPLPGDVVDDKVDAVFEHGVLTLRMPRPTRPPSTSRSIPIRRVPNASSTTAPDRPAAEPGGGAPGA